MALNAMIPLSMAQRAAPRTRLQTPVEAMGQVAQAVGGVQQMQQRQYEMGRTQKADAALDQLRTQLQSAGKNPDLNVYADVLVQSGVTPEQQMAGMKLKQALKEEADRKSLLQSFGTAAPSAVEPTTAEPVSALPAAVGATPTVSSNRLAAAPTPTTPAAVPVAGARTKPATIRVGNRDITEADAIAMSLQTDSQVSALGKTLLQQFRPAREGMSPLARLLAEQAALPEGDPNRAAYAAAIEKESQRAGAESPLARLIAERDKLPPNHPNRALYADAIKKATTQAEGTKVEVKLPAQEQEFEKALGSGQAKKILEDKTVAEDARSIIDTVQQGRQLLRSGMITGFGAEALTQIGAALNQAGISFASESVANTQAFAANMAQNVGRIIKQFGAGTGLSNADREYAEKMAGGKITLDRAAIERILDINERAARNVIAAHNKRVEGVKTNMPLTVELPPAMPSAPPAAPAGRPSLEQIFQPPKR